MKREKGIKHIGNSVIFFCHDGEGNYLMNKRANNARDEKGTWDCGGGGIEIHDTVLETLKKEIREEYSTDIISHEFLGYRDVHRENNGIKTHWIALDFKVLIDKSKVKNGEPHKFEKIGWFKINNFPTPLHSQLQYAIDKYKNKL